MTFPNVLLVVISFCIHFVTFTSSAFLTAALLCKYVCIYVQKLTQAIIFRLGKGWVLYLYSISLLNNGMGRVGKVNF